MVATHVDFAGQVLGEKVYQAVIVLFTVAGFLGGYVANDFDVTFKVWLAGFAVSGVATLVPWPCYRRQPVKWQAAVQPLVEGDAAAGSGGSSGAGSRSKGAPLPPGLKKRG